MKEERSAGEVRYFSCHIAGLGIKLDVISYTTGSKFSDGTGQLWFDDKNPRCVLDFFSLPNL